MGLYYTHKHDDIINNMKIVGTVMWKILNEGCAPQLIAYSEGQSLEHYSSGFEWVFAIADKPNDQRIFCAGTTELVTLVGWLRYIIIC